MQRISIHDYDRKYAKLVIKLETLEISSKNKELIQKFKDNCLLLGLSKARIIRYFRFFSFLLGVFKKDLDSVTKQDIEAIVASINARENFSPTTKHDSKVMLKRFYKWLYGNNEEYPPEVKWIKSRIKRTEKKLPGEGDLITEEDVKKLLDTEESLRNRAFIALLFESGCRIGEIGGMTVGSLRFDKYGTIIHISGKTGPREIRVVHATPYLVNWLNSHPFKDDKEKPLWINEWLQNHYAPLSYDAFRMLLARAFKNAGVKKRHNAHLFRHSRATFMANHLTEFQMNQYFGWVQGSDMPSTYVHLSGKNIDNAILEVSGMQKKQEEEPVQMSALCKRCDTINAIGSVFCNKCGCVVDAVTALKMEEEEKQNKLFHNLSTEALHKILQEKPELAIEFILKLTKQ